MPRKFSTVEAAASWLRESNPQLDSSLTSQQVVDKANEQYPDLLEIDPTYTGEIRSTGPKSLAEYFIGNESAFARNAQIPFNIAEGAVSGGLLGLPRKIGQEVSGGTYNPYYGQTPGYETGELIGEILLPYGLTRKVGGALVEGMPIIKWGTKKLPGLTYAIGAGYESMAVETAKDIIEGDLEPYDPVVSFAFGAIPEAGLRAGHEGLRKATKRLFNVPENKWANVENELAIRDRYGLPRIPAEVNPNDVNMIVHGRLRASAANRERLEALDLDVANSLDAFSGLAGRFGDNATVPNQQTVGRQLIEDATTSIERLQEKSNLLHKTLRDTQIPETGQMLKDVPIDATRTVTFTRRSGEEHTGTLLSDLHEIIGTGDIPKKEPWQKRLKELYDYIVEKHKTISEERLVPGAGKKEPAMGVDYLKKVWQGDEKGRRYLLEKSIEGNEYNFIAQHDIAIPQHAWGWWDDIRKQVGNLFDSPKVKKNASARRAVGSFYGAIQDHIYAQASVVDPTFDGAIKSANKLTTQLKDLEQHPLVSKILAAGGTSRKLAKEEDAIKLLFTDLTAIQESKKLLSPEAFAIARQSYLSKLLWDSFERGAGTKITNVSGKRLRSEVNKQVGGIYSPYWKEMFSDEGFTAVTGAPIKDVDIGTSKIENDFKEFLFATELFDRVSKYTKGGAEEISQMMAEHFSPGAMVRHPSLILPYLRGLYGQFAIMHKSSQLYFDTDVNKNIFFKGNFPRWGSPRFLGANIGGVDLGVTRRSATSATLNRMREAILRRGSEEE